MRTLSTLSAAILALGSVAQCPFTPTVAPAGLVLCPNEAALLSTEEYDAYQWYRDGEAIDGETGQTLEVSSMDAGSSFSVEATLDGCTEMSTAQLVDGWVFLLPFVVHAGDEPLYFGDNGEQHNCDGDSVLLIFSFSENVRWFRNGAEIPFATNDTLLVMESGAYTAEGAPDVCPDFIMNLGLEVPIIFDVPTQPVIVESNGQLCAEPEGVAYQWYMNGGPLVGNTPCIDPITAASYTVNVTYEIDCSVTSEPYVSTGSNEVEAADAPQLFPLPATDAVNVHWPSTRKGARWELVDAVGRRVLEGQQTGSSVEVIDLSPVQQGHYWLRSQGHRPMVLIVVK